MITQTNERLERYNPTRYGRSLFRRPMPDTCVSFVTPEGRALFEGALQRGGLEVYFPLAANFVTQNEPAYCGVSTLTMVLNTLAVDPKRTWKGPWRWFDEEVLSTCRTLEDIKQNGMTMADFACTARCNGLQVCGWVGTPPSDPQGRPLGLHAVSLLLSGVLAGLNATRWFFLSLQFSMCSLGYLRACQFPLHLLVSDLARPTCVSCPLPPCAVGHSTGLL